jgi:hypothetical protein
MARGMAQVIEWLPSKQEARYHQKRTDGTKFVQS